MSLLEITLLTTSILTYNNTSIANNPNQTCKTDDDYKQTIYKINTYNTNNNKCTFAIDNNYYLIGPKETNKYIVTNKIDTNNQYKVCDPSQNDKAYITRQYNPNQQCSSKTNYLSHTCATNDDCNQTNYEINTCNTNNNKYDFIIENNYYLINPKETSKCIIANKIDADNQCKVCNPSKNTKTYVTRQCDPNQQYSSETNYFNDTYTTNNNYPQTIACEINTYDLTLIEYSYNIQTNYYLINSKYIIDNDVATNNLYKVYNPTKSTENYIAIQYSPGQQCSSNQNYIAENETYQKNDNKYVSNDPCFIKSYNEQKIYAYTPEINTAYDDNDTYTKNNVYDDANNYAKKYTCTCETDDQYPTPNNTYLKTLYSDNTYTKININNGTKYNDENAYTKTDVYTNKTCENTPMSYPPNDDYMDSNCTNNQCTLVPTNTNEPYDDDENYTENDVYENDNIYSNNYTYPYIINDDYPSTTCNTKVCANKSCNLKPITNNNTCDDTQAYTENTTCQNNVYSNENDIIYPDNNNPYIYQICENTNSNYINKNTNNQTLYNNNMYCTDNDHCQANTYVNNGPLMYQNNNNNPYTITMYDDNTDNCKTQDTTNKTSCDFNDVYITTTSYQNKNYLKDTNIMYPDDNNPCTTIKCFSDQNQSYVTNNEPNTKKCNSNKSYSGNQYTPKDKYLNKICKPTTTSDYPNNLMYTNNWAYKSSYDFDTTTNCVQPFKYYKNSLKTNTLICSYINQTSTNKSTENNNQ